MDHQENSSPNHILPSTNHTLPSPGNDSFQLQSYFIIALSEMNEQTSHPQPHEAPPPLSCPKPLAE